MSVIRRAIERDFERRYWVAPIGTSGTPRRRLHGCVLGRPFGDAMPRTVTCPIRRYGAPDRAAPSPHASSDAATRRLIVRAFCAEGRRTPPMWSETTTEPTTLSPAGSDKRFASRAGEPALEPPLVFDAGEDG